MLWYVTSDITTTNVWLIERFLNFSAPYSHCYPIYKMFPLFLLLVPLLSLYQLIHVLHIIPGVHIILVAIIIIIIVKRDRQCKAEREHPISPKIPAPQYLPIDSKKRKGKIVEDYSRDRAA